eukprot:Skav225692  [mRNA]  locus=scaffold2526:93375:93575:+ [translate_table: standard]
MRSRISWESGNAKRERCPKALGPNSERPRTTAIMGFGVSFRGSFCQAGPPANSSAKYSTPPRSDNL